MKSISTLTLLLLLVCFSSFAQDETILLRPEAGKEYFYRFTDSEYIADENGEKRTELIMQKTLRIQFSNVKPENKELLRVKVIENKAEKPLDDPRGINDYMFPYFESTYFGIRNDNFYEELLCGINFQFEFDGKTGTVNLYNRPDVLLKVREIVRGKEFDEEDIAHYTNEFNEKGIPELPKRLNSIFSIPKDFQREINDNEKFATSINSKNEYAEISAKRLEREVGLNSLDIVYNADENFLKSFNTIKIDSVGRNT